MPDQNRLFEIGSGIVYDEYHFCSHCPRAESLGSFSLPEPTPAPLIIPPAGASSQLSVQGLQSAASYRAIICEYGLPDQDRPAVSPFGIVVRIARRYSDKAWRALQDPSCL